MVAKAVLDGAPMADQSTSPAPSKVVVFARRTGSTLVLWALVTWIFYSRYSLGFLGFIGILTLIATAEYFRMLQAAGIKCFPRFGVLMTVAYCGALYVPYLSGWQPLPYLDGLAVFITIVGSFTLQLRYPIRGGESLLAVAANVLAFIYIALLFNFASRLVFLVPDAGVADGKVGTQGAYLLLWLLAVTKFTDMGAYITGSMIGRHKMIPHVSPGKTWEGFVGALVFSQLAGCGLYTLFPVELAVFENVSHVVILSFLLCILAVIGDLAESIIKRALDAKDSGQMLPGIGGSLDLIDSVCFTAPALFFYLKWFLLHHA